MCGSLLHAGYIYCSSAVRWTLKPDAQLTSGVGLVVGSVFSDIYDWVNLWIAGGLDGPFPCHTNSTRLSPLNSFVKGSWHFRHAQSLPNQSIHTSLPSNSILISSKFFSHAFLSHPFRLWWLLMNVKAMGFVNLYMGSPRAAVLLCYIGGAPQRSWSGISLVYLNHTLTDQEVQWRNG